MFEILKKYLVIIVIFSAGYLYYIGILVNDKRGYHSDPKTHGIIWMSMSMAIFILYIIIDIRNYLKDKKNYMKIKDNSKNNFKLFLLRGFFTLIILLPLFNILPHIFIWIGIFALIILKNKKVVDFF